MPTFSARYKVNSIKYKALDNDNKGDVLIYIKCLTLWALSIARFSLLDLGPKLPSLLILADSADPMFAPYFPVMFSERSWGIDLRIVHCRAAPLESTPYLEKHSLLSHFMSPYI